MPKNTKKSIIINKEDSIDMYETSYPTNKALYTYKYGPGLDHKGNFVKFQKLVQ